MDASPLVSTQCLQMLIGKLLGDGCITKQGGRKPRFQFIHTTRDQGWCRYCYDCLANELSLAKPLYRKIYDPRTKKGYTECIQVQSRTSPIVTFLEKIWYKDRRKVIPFYFLEKYLNEISLAWWYQDDGHLSKKGYIPQKVILSTDNFTPIENKQLISLLKSKFYLHFKLDNQNRLILYEQMQIYFFLLLVEPYMHPSMDRKKSPAQTMPHFENKRTTIYLPSSINLRKPTFEINNQLDKLYELKEIIIDRKRQVEFFKLILSSSCFSEDNRGYQIIIKADYFNLLFFIKSRTGLTYSQIATTTFLMDNFFLLNL